MRPTEPLQLHHSWPLFGRERFELGLLFDERIGWDFMDSPALAKSGVGIFECDLVNGNRLSWSSHVYDLFGLPPNATPSREEAVSFYHENSRAALDRLRAYAIAHQRGFTLDTHIRPAQGKPRWMRVTGFPLIEQGRVVRLRGVKHDVTAAYRRN